MWPFVQDKQRAVHSLLLTSGWLALFGQAGVDGNTTVRAEFDNVTGEAHLKEAAQEMTDTEHGAPRRSTHVIPRDQ